MLNLSDASGLLPCENPKGSRNFDNDCIQRIVSKLQTDANNAEVLGIVAPTSGGSVASRMLWHYLGATGDKNVIDDSWLDPELLTQAKNAIANTFEASSFFSNLCSSGCCGPSGTSTIGSLITNLGVRPQRYFDTEADWWSDVTGNRDLINTVGGLLGSENAWDEIVTGLEGGYRNPYYAAFGGMTVNSVADTEVEVHTSGGTGRVIVRTPVEYWDYYDWCFGDQDCPASGTHPQDMRVGHFIALEEAGKGKPFNLYSYATITIEYEIACAGTTPSITDKNHRYSDYYVWVGLWTGAPSPVEKIDQPTGIMTPRFTDNWPELSVAQANFEDPLFPTENEMTARGTILTPWLGLME